MTKIPQEVLDYYFPWGVVESDFSERELEGLVNSLGYQSYMVRKAILELGETIINEFRKIFHKGE
jgi:hypothetical protein